MFQEDTWPDLHYGGSEDDGHGVIEDGLPEHEHVQHWLNVQGWVESIVSVRCSACGLQRAVCSVQHLGRLREWRLGRQQR